MSKVDWLEKENEQLRAEVTRLRTKIEWHESEWRDQNEAYDEAVAEAAAARVEVSQLRAEVERYRRPCEACGFKPPTHDHARDCPRLPALTIKPSEPYAARLEAELTAARSEIERHRAALAAAQTRNQRVKRIVRDWYDRERQGDMHPELRRLLAALAAEPLGSAEDPA